MAHEVILIVDDNAQISEFLAGTVLPSLGYESLVAETAAAAVQVLQSHRSYIDLMVLDLQLPDMSGLDLLRQLDKDGFNVPTILFTGHGSEEVAVDAFRLGVQDYLTKPVDLDVLRGAISRALTETRLRREKARLTAQLQDQVAWMTALSKVSQTVTSTLDIDEVLRRIVEAGVFLTRAEEGFLALLDKESGQLYLRAVKNIDEEASRTMRLPVMDSLLGQVFQTRRPLRANQAGERLPLKVSTGYLVYSLLHVPILSKGVPLGVLSVDNRTNRQQFKEGDEVMLSSLADYAAVALENASLYQQARQELQERERMAEALRESEERFALAVRGANDGLWDWNLKTGKIYFSPRWKVMLGYGEEEITDNPNEWLGRIHPEDVGQLKRNLSAHLKGLSAHFESEYRILHKDGNHRWMLSRGIAVFGADGAAYRMAGSQNDITLRKEAEGRLIHDAVYDSLTELPNRELFTDRLRHAIEHGKRHQDYLYAVLFMDLDRFKDVNDSLGHYKGDHLLVGVGRLLESILRPSDTVARLGGDEFVVLLEDINNISDATIVANRILSKLATTPLIEDSQLVVSASIGIVLSLSGYESPEDVLRDADIAMYRAKATGRGRYEIFDSAMRERIMSRLELETELRQALDRHELVANYQPIVNVNTGRLIGLEALVRWMHPKRGLLMPGSFIPIAEETRLITHIDRYILLEACQRIQEWNTLYPSDPPLTINANISAIHVTQPDFVESIRNILATTGLAPGLLNLEITENAIMENFEHTTEILRKLQEIGVHLHIDDFGIGYSSLNYLSRFPINSLKIDRSFIKMMEADSNYMKIVQAIVKLTHSLGMTVIAEGVESDVQLSRLQALDCEFMQGALVSMPISGEDITDYLTRLNADETGSCFVLKPAATH